MARKAVKGAPRRSCGLFRDSQGPHHERWDGHSARKAVVEPMLSTQWFVRMKPLADPGGGGRRETDFTRFVPQAVGEHVLCLVAGHSRLVHQPTAVVGASHPRMALRRLQ